MDSVIKGVLLVAFVIICILLVLLVLVQDQDNSGMGGLLGGGNSAAFGSHSASVLTKATIVLVVLFFVITFAIAKILPSKADSASSDIQAVAGEIGTEIDAADVSPAENGTWWKTNDDSSATGVDSINADSAPEAEESVSSAQ